MNFFKVPKAMHWYFFYEMFLGLSILLAWLVVGPAGGKGESVYAITKGESVFALMAGLAFFRSRPADEREIQLWYKTGFYSLLGLIFSAAAVYRLLPFLFHLHCWIDPIYLILAAFFFFHGLLGNIIFVRE